MTIGELKKILASYDDTLLVRVALKDGVTKVRGVFQGSGAKGDFFLDTRKGDDK